MSTAIGARNLPRAVALAAALGMVAGGLLLRVCERASKGSTGGRDVAAGPVSLSSFRDGGGERANTGARRSEESAKEEEQGRTVGPGEPSESRGVSGQALDRQASRPKAGMASGGGQAESLGAGRGPAAPSLLPPFLPPLYGPETGEEMRGPPPGVLWLSGVIQGKPRLALLRRDGNRYLVREGEMIEGRYRVSAISGNSVTLERGNRKQTLRLGQY